MSSSDGCFECNINRLEEVIVERFNEHFSAEAVPPRKEGGVRAGKLLLELPEFVDTGALPQNTGEQPRR